MGNLIIGMIVALSLSNLEKSASMKEKMTPIINSLMFEGYF